MSDASRKLGAGEGFAPVKRSAYERFHMQLLSGRIRPGQMLAQRELVEMLSVSLGALRELLPKLEAEGLISVQPQRGIIVTSIDLRMIRNAYQLRMAMERESVIAAVCNVDNHAAVAHQIELHRSILERAKTDSSRTIMDEAQAVDNGMHIFLVEQTLNDLLIQAYNINSIRVRLINIDRQRLTPIILPDAFGDHLSILEAILARQRGTAVAAMERHIEKARARAVEM
jgi:DNA-binding GntR family transcriptional regulator